MRSGVRVVRGEKACREGKRESEIGSTRRERGEEPTNPGIEEEEGRSWSEIDLLIKLWSEDVEEVSADEGEGGHVGRGWTEEEEDVQNGLGGQGCEGCRR